MLPTGTVRCCCSTELIKSGINYPLQAVFAITSESIQNGQILLTFSTVDLVFGLYNNYSVQHHLPTKFVTNFETSVSDFYDFPNNIPLVKLIYRSKFTSCFKFKNQIILCGILLGAVSCKESSHNIYFFIVLFSTVFINIQFPGKRVQYPGTDHPDGLEDKKAHREDHDKDR